MASSSIDDVPAVAKNLAGGEGGGDHRRREWDQGAHGAAVRGARRARRGRRHPGRARLPPLRRAGRPGVASYAHCDVTVEADVAGAVDHAVARFGGLDVMFNNAGIGGAPCHSIRDTDKADFERVLAVNLVGPFLGTKHAARVMVPARRGGCIIGTSSVASAVAGAASHAYTRHGIRVNCVSPAAAATPLATAYVGLEGKAFEEAMEAVANLKGVRLTVDDIANAVLFLASDEARFISGHNLLIDGGFSVVNLSYGFFKD
ncbi:hypothetical protein ACP70R_009592 [Stipagrostis hirtigluma subsp. patula]